MKTISEATAWRILRCYVADLLKIDTVTLIAVYATGSLPGGYYRPGQSDIDAVLIVADGSEHVWGTDEVPSPALAALNRSYLARYRIPKDFGPFPLQQRELFPPYDPDNDVLALEIARLKVQGKRVYGCFDLDAVPMPTAEDFLAGARRFELWYRDSFAPATPSEALSPAACVNTILMHLGRFLQIKRGMLVFDKRKIVRAYLDSDPPFADTRALRLVEAFLASPTVSDDEARQLRAFMIDLRDRMNEYLGIEA